MRFELGEPERARGHAILYFRDPSDPARVWATYLVVPPIRLDLSKYVPPLLAAQMPAGLMGMSESPSVYPLPPFPEAMEGLDQLRQLALARADDLIDGGVLPVSDLSRLMLAVSEMGERYGALYERALANPAEPPAPAAQPSEGHLDVDEILLDVMTPAERIGRLARALGTLRYAVEGGDVALARDTLAGMEKIGRRLAPSYRVDELLVAAQDPSSQGRLLAELYVQRCYKLAGEDYAAVAELEQRIAAARAEGR